MCVSVCGSERFGNLLFFLQPIKQQQCFCSDEVSAEAAGLPRMNEKGEVRFVSEVRQWDELLSALRLRSKSHTRADGGVTGEQTEVRESHRTTCALCILYSPIYISFIKDVFKVSWNTFHVTA